MAFELHLTISMKGLTDDLHWSQNLWKLRL